MATPVAMPVEDPTVAIPGNPEVQLPPAVTSVKVVVAPMQMVPLPTIAAGVKLTVTVVAAAQPVGNV